MGLFSKKSKPPKQIELSEKNKKVRIILLCVFIVIAVVAFGIGVSSLLTIEEGWHSIEVDSDELNCGDDFVFDYYFGKDGTPMSEYKNVCNLYSTLATKSYLIFSAENIATEVPNLAYLNHHINETVKVDPALYSAFEQLAKYSSRALYLGPICATYSDLCLSENESFAEVKDPKRNPEVAEYFSRIIDFIKDPSHIELKLLDGGQVCLAVSEEYAAFAEENGFDRFLDFFRIKNAFVVDFLAETMLENGYSYGAISSYDGYTRTLDQKHVYAYTLFDRRDQVVSAIATLSYQNGGSLVYLRNYPMSEQESFFYYASERLTIPPMFHSENGLYQTATNGMIGYSKHLGCAEIVLSLMPLYTAEEVDVAEMLALNVREIATVWCEDHLVCYTDKAFSPELLITDGEYAYESVFVTENR